MADRILEAAAHEFGQSGYAGATTAAIARRAEATEAQIFRLWGSKQELFRAAIFTPLNRHFDEFQSRFAVEAGGAESRRELARRYIRELQDFCSENSAMLMSLIVAAAYSPDATGGPDEIEGLRAYFGRGAATMAATGASGGTVAPELMVRVSFAAVLACVLFRDWLFPAGLAGEEQVREAIVDFVIDGLRATDAGMA